TKGGDALAPRDPARFLQSAHGDWSARAGRKNPAHATDEPWRRLFRSAVVHARRDERHHASFRSGRGAAADQRTGDRDRQAGADDAAAYPLTRRGEHVADAEVALLRLW